MPRLPAAEASKQDYERAVEQAADLGLFSVGGPFERFPGAVLVAGRNGLVLGANQAAEAIATLLKRGAPEDLREAVNAALDGRAAQINPLLLPPADSEGAVGLAYDLAVLPWGDGTAALLLGRDITLERSLRSALIESRQRYKDLVEASSDFAWETDADGQFTFVSSQGTLGYAAAELVGMPALDLQIDRLEGQDSPFTTRIPIREIEVWVRRADGESACLLATGLPLTGPEGQWCGARGLCRNITAERTHEAALASDRHRERLLAYILGIVRDEMDPTHMLSAAAGALVPALPATGACIYRRDRSGALTRAAQAGDLPPEELLEPVLRRVAIEEDEVEMSIEEGSLYAMATCFQGACNGVLFLWRTGTVGAWKKEDRSLLNEVAAQIGLTNRQMARQEELEELSSTDPLTGLLNRRGFMEALEQRYTRLSAGPGGAALLYIDMDNFKQVNDRHGHQQGDLALIALARILRDKTRIWDLVARLGGDEFAVFIEDITPAGAEHKGRELLKAGTELRAYSGDSDTPLGLSIGIAACDPERQEDLRGLMNRADGAMYQAKRRGKGGLELAPGAEDGAAP